MSWINTMTAASIVAACLVPVANAAPAANIALNKPATATNTYGIYVPARVTDADITTIWNGGSTTACVQVDLQAAYAVQRVVVSSNQWGNGSSLFTVFQVSFSTDNTNWTDLGAQTTGNGNQSFTFNAGSAQMRHVRFCTLPSSTNWATLSELEVYAGSSTPSPIPTLSQWGMMLTSVLIGVGTFLGLRRRSD